MCNLSRRQRIISGIANTERHSRIQGGACAFTLITNKEVILVTDIVIDIRQIVDAEYSDIYKMTADMVNIAGTVTAISISMRCGRQTMINNVEVDTPELYW